MWHFILKNLTFDNASFCIKYAFLTNSSGKFLFWRWKSTWKCWFICKKRLISMRNVLKTTNVFRSERVFFAGFILEWTFCAVEWINASAGRDFYCMYSRLCATWGRIHLFILRFIHPQRNLIRFSFFFPSRFVKNSKISSSFCVFYLTFWFIFGPFSILTS